MELPARIGKYELLEFLGGGMSHVYRARDTVIGRIVAVKILTEQGCADDEVKARFLAEARMAGSLAHDHILSIYDFGEDEQKRPFMVMEFLRGQDLRSAIRGGQTGDHAAKLKIAIQVAKALDYTHSQKIVHRDIKPENVHINAAGVAKLIDFGIAKTEGLQMTRAGYVLGTPFYMAPEQVMGENITEQVDVYAFGILLFELFAGCKPIHAETVERIFYCILNEPLNLEPLLQCGAPKPAVDLVARCTAKKPAERPSGFAPVIAELEAALAGTASPVPVSRDEPTLVLPTAAVERRAAPTPGPASELHTPSQRPAWMWPAGIIAVAALGVGFWFALGSKGTPSGPAASAKIDGALPASLNLTSGDMVLIPGGPFLKGADNVSTNLPDYYIDRTEVTNRAYQQFCSQTAHALPAGFPANQPDLPIVNVTIGDARAFAAWANKRLPTGDEWEKAARGKEGWPFSWGQTKDGTKANIHSQSLQAASAFPGDTSPFGVSQTVGNAQEMVSDERPDLTKAQKDAALAGMSHQPGASERWFVLRGLSFRNPRLEDAATYDEGFFPESFQGDALGFRCVRSAR